jgi:prepilin-type N-terminal cleavage/methylation domain-containing protein
MERTSHHHRYLSITATRLIPGPATDNGHRSGYQSPIAKRKMPLYDWHTSRLFLQFINALKITMKNITKRAPQAGFTLIEILIVIGIIAILAAIVLVAVNPAKQFQKANDAQRSSNVNAILNSVGQYMVDNQGTIPSAITTTAQDISNAGADLCGVLTPTYLAALPGDPTNGSSQSITSCTTYNTGYQIKKDANNRITITAPHTQGGTTISVTR